MEAFKMQPFGKLDGIAVSLRRDNVDTDQVIPARYLKVARAEASATRCSATCASTRTAIRVRTSRSTIPRARARAC